MKYFSRYNSDRQQIIDEVFAKLNKKDYPSFTRETVEHYIMQYESVFLRYIAKDFGIHYQWHIPFVGKFYVKNYGRNKTYKYRKQARRYSLIMKYTFNEIFKNI